MHRYWNHRKPSKEEKEQALLAEAESNVGKVAYLKDTINTSGRKGVITEVKLEEFKQKKPLYRKVKKLMYRVKWEDLTPALWTESNGLIIK